MQTTCTRPASWTEYTGTTFECCKRASRCGSSVGTVVTLMATRRLASTSCLARYTRANAPRPSSSTTRKCRNSSFGRGKKSSVDSAPSDIRDGSGIRDGSAKSDEMGTTAATSVAGPSASASNGALVGTGVTWATFVAAGSLAARSGLVGTSESTAGGGRSTVAESSGRGDSVESGGGSSRLAVF